MHEGLLLENVYVYMKAYMLKKKFLEQGVVNLLKWYYQHGDHRPHSKDHDWRRSVKLYLVTIFLSANMFDSWNLCITLVLQGLAFLHDQQEVVGHEPPGDRAPLRGLIMSLLLPYCLATEYGKNIS